jgi:hydrogenase maturation protein HypF
VQTAEGAIGAVWTGAAAQGGSSANTVSIALSSTSVSATAGRDRVAAVSTEPGQERAACRLEVRGTVQGVGFRPFVYRLARGLGLDGTVRNDGGYVVVEAAGPASAVAELARRLRTEAPPRARVTGVTVSAAIGGGAPHGVGFRVADSGHAAGADLSADLPPDLATCEACLRELFDPADRRHRYPFVNCTDCGPRATIVDELPYDRTRTVMRAFRLCPPCAAEYADPADRRFHAEPVACPSCGPRLSWWDGGWAGEPVADRPDQPVGEAALAAAVGVIRVGGVVAVKGLGGYQLVCDATAPAAVAALRARKRRPAKPFAVMVADLGTARALAEVDDGQAAVLTGPGRPVVLLRARAGGRPPLAAGVHPGTGEVGLFLPTTPLHHLLLAEVARPLVVTSGNRADEPIAVDDADALIRLAGVADGFLRHDRPIRSRYDDSVTRVVGGRERMVRRARGYAPAPLPLPVPASRSVLAVGAQLKHTYVVAAGDRALVGPHTGDLSDADAFDAFTASLAHLSRLYGIEPQVVAHDLHPGYLSTRFARRWPAGRRLPVQHHHAHVASCAAEHGLAGRFLGVAYDGLGLGDDGTLWGGEVLVADLTGYRRTGRFGRAPLPGAEAAVRRPARMALGYLYGAEGDAGVDPELAARFTARLDPGEVAVVRRMIERGVNSPRASSAGRLFDAVASLLGLRDEVSYEGEAAVALQTAACTDGGTELSPLPWRLTTVDGLAVYDPVPTLAAVLDGLAAGIPVGRLAARFHRTVATVTVALCERARSDTGLSVACLSGGVFQNMLLADLVTTGLTSAGFTVWHNERVPANDGGVSYGQAAVAAARTRGRG